MEQSLMVQVKYLGATNTTGSRIKFISYDFANRTKTKTMRFNDQFNDIQDMAVSVLTSQNVHIDSVNCRSPKLIIMCHWKNHYALSKFFGVSHE